MSSKSIIAANRGPRRLAAALVGLVAIAAYLNTLPNDYCYDDVLVVRDSSLVNAPGKALDVWRSDYWGESNNDWSRRDLLYRPVTVASFRAVRSVFGPFPLPQHAINILLHAVVSVLVLQLALAMGLSTRVATTSGLLFAVLPIHVEAVAAIVGRADLLASVGLLTTVLLHRTPGIAARVAAAVAAFAAMGSKESGLAVLPILMLWDWLAPRGAAEAAPPLERKKAERGGLSSSRSPVRGIRVAPAQPLRTFGLCLIPLIAYLVLRYIALGAFLQQPAPTCTINALVDAPTWQRLLGVFQLVGMYVQKTVWPSVLCISYAINAVRPAQSLADPRVLLGFSVLAVGLVASTVFWRRGQRSVAFLVAAALLAYAPTANAFVLIQVFFAERIWYLPSVFLCVAVGMGCSALLGLRVARIAGLLLLAGMMLRGWVRNAEWRDNGTLFASCYRDYPESIACLNLYGGWLAAHGNRANGIELLSQSIEIDLGFTDAQRALGQTYLEAGDFGRAVQHLQAADMQVPNHPPTVAALAAAKSRLGTQEGDRVDQLRRAADAAPTDLVAELAYVRALLDVGRRDDALSRFEQREKTFGNAAEWQHQHAVTLVFLDQRDAAIARYQKALELDPGNAQVGVELAMLLLERRSPGDIESAGLLCERAVAMAPNDTVGYVCRGEQAAVCGDLAAAVASYQKAISLLPADHPQRRILEQRAKTLGG